MQKAGPFANSMTAVEAKIYNYEARQNLNPVVKQCQLLIESSFPF